ncbi:MAG: hypothetical protein GWP08_03045 [Nitrospiraceae bacterium]|nr:hypothetical protein [Nitrospiraceae bacterium]
MLNSDLLGLAAALFVASIVAGIGFWRGYDLLVITIRAGVTFVGTYSVVFLLVHVILRTTLTAIAEQKRVEREEREREAAEMENATETESGEQ